MNKDTFTKGISMLLSSFRNLNIKEDTLDLWFQLLDDMSDNDFMVAIKKICTETREIYPTTNIVALIREQFKVDNESMALLAWQSVLGAIESFGSYETVSFQDRAIHSAIDLIGGWIELCSMTTEEEQWKKKDFIQAYKAVINRKDHPEKLAGRLEIDNASKGLTEYIPKPKQISDNGKIKRIENE